MLKGYAIFRNFILCLFLIFSFIDNNNATTNKYRKYNISNGLTDNHITGQLIDKNNYLWVATEKGLQKFDGYNYIYFTFENTKIPDNHLVSITQNKTTIFAASKNFISAIDNKSSVSRTIIKLSSKISKIYYTSNNILVVFAENGEVYLFDKYYKLIKKLNYEQAVVDKLEEFNGSLYFNVLKGYIWKIDLMSFQVSNLQNIEVAYKGSELKNIKHLGLLFTNSQGMFKYNISTNKFEMLGTQFKRVNCITQVNDSIICLLYNHFNIKFYNFRSNSFLQYEFTTPDNSYVEEINILNGNVILGTNQGIIAFQFNSKSFEQISIENIGNVVPRAIIHSKTGELFLINNNNISVVKKGETTPIRIYNNNYNFYSAIEVGNDIYIGTEGAGLKKISTTTYQVSDVTLLKQFSDRRHIVSLAQFDNQKLLLGCAPGLFVYDIISGKLTPLIIYTSGKDLYKLNYGYNLFDLTYRHIVVIKDEIWMSSNKGIVILNKDLSFKEIINKSSGPSYTNLICDSINYIYQRNKNEFWIATDNGFQKFNNKTKSFSSAIRSSALRINTKVIAIIPDNEGRLWMPSYNGVLLYNPENKILTNYRQHDGLVNDEYNFASFCKLNDGNIVLGGINGYQLIKPNNINQDNKKITIKITDIVRLEDDNTFKSLNNKNLIELDLEDDFIQVRITTNEYAHNESLSYFYRIGENANWISTNKLPIINLSYLPRGTEYIYVKAINDDDINSQSTIKIPVIINTKIYKEWWFIPSILFVFVTLLSLVIIQTNRVRNISVKKIEKLKSEELLLQNLGKQKELNSLKTKFIRLVSHEYRTPLTGIATSLDLMDMLLANSTSDATILKEKRHMKNIRLQVDRMSKLIKGVQSLNRMEDFIAKMNMEEGDIAAYVKYHIELLVPNNFTLKFHSTSETIVTTFDKDIMLQILSNIVSNSVKYSVKERKELIVSCELLSDNAYTIVIQDFGVGIPEKDLPLVFDTFYRSQAIENIQGIGLGLSITKQLIEQMNGTIEIHSILDYGTTVTIKFSMSEA